MGGLISSLSTVEGGQATLLWALPDARSPHKSTCALAFQLVNILIGPGGTPDAYSHGYSMRLRKKEELSVENVVYEKKIWDQTLSLKEKHKSIILSKHYAFFYSFEVQAHCEYVGMFSGSSISINSGSELSRDPCSFLTSGPAHRPHGRMMWSNPATVVPELDKRQKILASAIPCYPRRYGCRRACELRCEHESRFSELDFCFKWKLEFSNLFFSSMLVVRFRCSS